MNEKKAEKLKKSEAKTWVYTGIIYLILWAILTFIAFQKRPDPNATILIFSWVTGSIIWLAFYYRIRSLGFMYGPGCLTALLVAPTFGPISIIIMLIQLNSIKKQSGIID